jgi:hypothetical protein
MPIHLSLLLVNDKRIEKVYNIHQFPILATLKILNYNMGDLLSPNMSQIRNLTTASPWD